MNTGLNDQILDKTIRYQGLISQKIKTTLKGDKPFASQPIPNDDLIYWKNTLGYLDMPQLVWQYGREAVNELLYDISKLERRRNLKGV